MSIRPIREPELDAFATFSADAGENARLRAHLNKALTEGETSLDRCLVADDQGRFAGRIYLWSLPANPVFVHLFDLDWSREDWRELGLRLIQGAVGAVRDAAPNGILYALDRPHPWHSQPGRRTQLFQAAGFALARRGQRWEWTRTAAGHRAHGRLDFRPLPEVGVEAFREAIARVSDGTLDGRLQQMRARLGREVDAAEHLRLLLAMSHQPDWWQLAFAAEGELIGLFVAGGSRAEPVLALIGVVAEQRGHGYVDDLLAQAIATLAEGGAKTIRADTDLANAPMANAFRRAGFHEFMSRDEYVLITEEQRGAR